MPSTNEVGVMFWAGRDPSETLAELTSLGVSCGQLAIPGEFPLEGAALQEAAASWKHAAQAAQFRIYTVFAAYSGESYADIPTVRHTVGFVPQATREEREQRTFQVSRFAYELGVRAIATHIGCIPEDHADPEFQAVMATVRRVCDYALQFDQSLALETGQEPAAALLRFLQEAERGNLGINFDPANMILYGSGDPIEALQILRTHILSVHCKDGDWPPPGQPDTLGIERPLGAGAVNIGRFLKELGRIGYTGPLAVEREIPDPKQRLADIQAGIALVRRLQLSGE